MQPTLHCFCFFRVCVCVCLFFVHVSCAALRDSKKRCYYVGSFCLSLLNGIESRYLDPLLTLSPSPLKKRTRHSKKYISMGSKDIKGNPQLCIPFSPSDLFFFFRNLNKNEKSSSESIEKILC